MDTTVLRAYAFIVEEGSFSAAAQRLGISRSMCSKHINDLEASLGARLLTRSTRSVKPTAIGADYYVKVRRILDLLEEASESVRTETSTATGRLKIGSPVSYTLNALQPHILGFMAAFPSIQLEVVLDDRSSDLIADGFDAVIRAGVLEDTSMLARRLHGSPTHVVASPGYLRDHGVPRRPGDLVSHRTLYYTNLRGSGTWPFQLGADALHQKIHPAFSSNNGDIIRAAAAAGQGVAHLPEFIIGPDLKAGTLVPILTEYEMPELPISVVYPTRKHTSAALQVFLDFVTHMDL